MYGEQVKTANVIDTSRKKNTSKKNKQININENKGEITSITGLATTAVLNGANKNIGNLV